MLLYIIDFYFVLSLIASILLDQWYYIENPQFLYDHYLIIFYPY